MRATRRTPLAAYANQPDAAISGMRVEKRQRPIPRRLGRGPTGFDFAFFATR